MRIERRELAPGHHEEACVVCGGGWTDWNDAPERYRYYLETGDQLCFECVADGAEFIAAELRKRAEEHREIAVRYEAAADAGIWIPEHYWREAAAKTQRRREAAERWWRTKKDEYERRVATGEMSEWDNIDPFSS